MNKNYKMHNESEFQFDEVLTLGFTNVPNEIFDDERLTNNAIATYCKIIRRKNIDGWKIYQSSLTNEKNGKSKIMSAMKELITCGWIKKIQLRNEKGHLNGVKYVVYSSPKNPEVLKDINSEEIKKEDKPKDHTLAQKVKKIFKKPTLEKPKSENPTLENQTLQINTSINKKNINKDYINTTQFLGCSIYDNIKVPNQVELIENNTHLNLSKNQISKVLLWNIARLRKTIEIFKNLAGKYFTLLEKIYKDNGNFVPKNRYTVKNNTISTFENFDQRTYDYNKLEKQLLGWE